MSRQPVRVAILGQQYTLLSSADPREVEQLAASVDELMASIAARSPSADNTRVAVLAALHLADRLREVERDLNHVQQKTRRFAELLDQAFEERP